MSVTPEEIHAGQAIYTPKTLAVYDLIVLGLSNRFIWKCPTARLLAYYNRSVSGNHLDVGVGTGYFLDRCRFPTLRPRVALMDLNRDALSFASRVMSRRLMRAMFWRRFPSRTRVSTWSASIISCIVFPETWRRRRALSIFSCR